jgi:hypothetical protein
VTDLALERGLHFLSALRLRLALFTLAGLGATPAVFIASLEAFRAAQTAVHDVDSLAGSEENLVATTAKDGYGALEDFHGGVAFQGLDAKLSSAHGGHGDGSAHVESAEASFDDRDPCFAGLKEEGDFVGALRFDGELRVRSKLYA